MQCERLLVANRGEIAVRIIKTCKRLGIIVVAIFSDADAEALHVRLADHAVSIGPADPKQSYLNGDAIIRVALDNNCQAIHPGYGFLSENVVFARKVKEAGLIFVGPTAEHINLFGYKHEARKIARENSVPLLPGSTLLTSSLQAQQVASEIGYPVIIKPTAGGGGIGMCICDSDESIENSFLQARAKGTMFFEDGGVFLEKYIPHAHHIEIQVFGDGRGKVISLGERECSIQRRHQKVVEETPSPFVDTSLRQQLSDAAVRLLSAVNYANVGTVEFIVDNNTKEFYFLEVNTRLQVEHGVTECVTGIDLVEWMILQSCGAGPDLASFAEEYEKKGGPNGHAIEFRIYAEDTKNDYLPQPGKVGEVIFPEWGWARWDGWIEEGCVVSQFYDPLLTKAIVHSRTTRAKAIKKMNRLLWGTSVEGIVTNLPLLRSIAGSQSFAEGKTTTKFLEYLSKPERSIQILKPGMYTSIQDYPGRVGYWNVGIPPSGPMDPFACRIANKLVGNSDTEAALEITLAGPDIKFNTDCIVALTGATMEANLQSTGEVVPRWKAFRICKGDTLSIGSIHGHGARSYLAVEGGFDVPKYLGSKATFPLGKLGGYEGRILAAGDIIPLGPLPNQTTTQQSELSSLPPQLIPTYRKEWRIGVLPGPHEAPDFFLQEDVDMFYSTPWQVHYNSNRLGIRLEGPRPKFARSNGGEGGNHPSNIHDCEYAIGTINFTGDMPIILTADGPSLGGFVCIATVVRGELWKLGQLQPHDTILFHRISSIDASLSLLHTQETILQLTGPNASFSSHNIESLAAASDVSLLPTISGKVLGSSALIEEIEEDEDRHQPKVQYRLAGDAYLLVEYGPMILDLNLRFRAHVLEQEIRSRKVPGVLELSPGVRSLQIKYDILQISLPNMLTLLKEIEGRLPSSDDIMIDTEVFHLPLSFKDSSVRATIDKYMKSVRSSAAYLPDNVEFIGRNNGLDIQESKNENESEKETNLSEKVAELVTSTRYMVLGLGDVYLGAPCAVPLDPRCRVVVPKYNPARTWTQEGIVGIGGAYMCIYPMESPGGYQLIGRTLPIWNTHQTIRSFKDAPWMLRFFQQIQFELVSEEEMDKLRKEFKANQFTPKRYSERFSLKEYNSFLSNISEDIHMFHKTQSEGAKWGQLQAEICDREYRKELEHKHEEEVRKKKVGAAHSSLEEAKGEEGIRIVAPIIGNIWQVKIEQGSTVESGDILVVLESMKTELAIRAPVKGIVSLLTVQAGDVTEMDQLLAIIAPAQQTNF